MLYFITTHIYFNEWNGMKYIFYLFKGLFHSIYNDCYVESNVYFIKSDEYNVRYVSYVR